MGSGNTVVLPGFVNPQIIWINEKYSYKFYEIFAAKIWMVFRTIWLISIHKNDIDNIGAPLT
jgi:hypothetical protein